MSPFIILFTTMFEATIVASRTGQLSPRGLLVRSVSDSVAVGGTSGGICR